MNTFKICRGLEANLPAMKNNGAIYFCKDTSNLYIDYLNENGELTRSKVAAGLADKLHYLLDGEEIIIDPATIYFENNPPPYPVTSVEGSTGDVVLKSEPWTFTLANGSTVTKGVVIK